MRQASFGRLSASLLVLATVECIPSLPSSPSPGRPDGEDSLLRTMGQVHESNCRGNKMAWTKSNPTWQNLKLADSFTLYQNVWQAEKVLDAGKSEITCKSFERGSLAWNIKFEMPSASQDNNQVKAFSNVAWAGKRIQVKDAKQFSTVWDWKLTEESQDLVADVSYDIFLANNPECNEQKCASREIMIWLSAINGAKPAGARTGTIKVGSEYEFQVWQGTATVPVVSIFPADEGRKFTSFKADFKEILKTLQGQSGVSQDEYIVSVGAGIEIFKGKGNLATYKYTFDLY